MDPHRTAFYTCVLACASACALWTTVPSHPHGTLVHPEPVDALRVVFVEPPHPPEPAWLEKLADLDPALPRTAAGCKRIGGLWRRGGIGGDVWQCLARSSDAGKQCADHADCKSLCVTSKLVRAGTASTGVCFAYHDVDNMCVQGISRGVAEAHLCVN